MRIPLRRDFLLNEPVGPSATALAQLRRAPRASQAIFLAFATSARRCRCAASMPGMRVSDVGFAALNVERRMTLWVERGRPMKYDRTLFVRSRPSQDN